LPNRSLEVQRTNSHDSTGAHVSSGDLDIVNPHPSVADDSAEIDPDRESFQTDELEGLAEDRVVTQGYLLCLKKVSRVRQWKRRWIVLRGKSFTLYKNFEVYSLLFSLLIFKEYKPLQIIPLQNVLAAVDLDPVSRTKRHCFQVVTKSKVLKFCADSEAEVDRWLGALVSLIEGNGSISGVS
jgi:PH domain